jgi:hypothetical protein
VRDYNTLEQLRWVLERTDTVETDVVVLSARLLGAGSAEYDIRLEQVFADFEQMLFTKAVGIAESFGKTISLLVVPARDVWSAIMQTANALESSAIVSGLSSKMTAQQQAYNLGRAWEGMPEPRRQIVFQVVRPDMEVETFRIGPHNPSMKTEDIMLVHKLWLDLTNRGMNPERLHHSDIVTVALTRLARDYGRDPDEVMKALRRSRDDARFGSSPKELMATGIFQTPLRPPASDRPPTEPRTEDRPRLGEPKE